MEEVYQQTQAEQRRDEVRKNRAYTSSVFPFFSPGETCEEPKCALYRYRVESRNSGKYDSQICDHLMPRAVFIMSTRFHLIFTLPLFYVFGQIEEGLSTPALPRDKDPFWDPVEPLLLGTAHLWLQSLAFRIPLEEQLEVQTEPTQPPHMTMNVERWLTDTFCRCWAPRVRRRPFCKQS